MDLVLLIILVLSLPVYVFFSKRKKRALLISFGVVVVYHLTMSYICGPSSKDIKAIKPMAQVMKSYILEHGMPKNLEMIPNLPYKLYQKKDNKSFYYFKVGNDKYEIFKSSQHGLQFTSLVDRAGSRTRYSVIFLINSNGKYSLKREEYFAVHYSGICQPMRQ